MRWHEIWDKFKSFLEPEFRTLVEDAIKADKKNPKPTYAPDTPRGRVRYGIAVVHQGLVSFQAEFRK